MKTKKEWLQSKNLTELSEMLKALGHPSRIAIMYLLYHSKEKRMTVKCVYHELKMPQPIISRHLGILKNCGLLKRVAEGSDTFYELNLENKNSFHISQSFNCED